MKPRWIVPLAAAIAGSLFVSRKTRHAAGGATWGPAGTSFPGFRNPVRPHAFGRMRHRRRGLLSRIFGFFWGLFWLCFGLSFVFGGGEFRHAVFSFFGSFGHNMARFFTALFTSAGGLMQ